MLVGHLGEATGELLRRPRGKKLEVSRWSLEWVKEINILLDMKLSLHPTTKPELLFAEPRNSFRLTPKNHCRGMKCSVKSPLSNSHIQLQAKEEQKLQKKNRKRITRTHFEEILESDFVVRRIWFAWLGTNSISNTISLYQKAWVKTIGYLYISLSI